MNRKLATTDVIVSFSLGIFSFLIYLLSDAEEIKSLCNSSTYIKIFSLLGILASFCCTIFFFCRNMLKDIDDKMSCFHQNHNIICDIGHNIKLLKEENIFENITEQNKNLINQFTENVNERHKIIIEGIGHNKLIALESGHLKFAEMMFDTAKTKVICTSVVHPKWYEQVFKHEYINNQVKLINNGIKFERIFFISRKAKIEDKIATYNVITQLLSKGFDIVLSKTPTKEENGIIVEEEEQDVALIDNSYAIKANISDVDKYNYQSGECFIDTNSDGYKGVVTYIDKVHARKDNETFKHDDDTENNKQRLSRLLLVPESK